MNELRHYVRDAFYRPIGLLVAFAEGEQVHIGFSSCNVKAGDHFTKAFAVRVSTGRAKTFTEKNVTEVLSGASFETAAKIPAFADRCERYFQGKQLPNWVNQLKEF